MTKKAKRRMIIVACIDLVLKTLFIGAAMLLMFWAVGYFVAEAAPVMENALYDVYETTWKIYEMFAG